MGTEGTNKETEQLTLDMTVSYPWSDNYGLLSEIQRATKYLAITGLIYISPNKPPDIDLQILVTGTT